MQPLLQTSSLVQQLGPEMLCSAQGPHSQRALSLQPLLPQSLSLNLCHDGAALLSPNLHSSLCHF